MKRALFDASGFPLAFYAPEIHGDDIPLGTVEITDEQWQELIDNQGRRAWVDGQLVVVTPPLPVPRAVRVAKGDIWRRATDDEAATIDAALQAKPLRLRNLFRDAAYLSSDDELWPDLYAGFVVAFGAPRAAELLAPNA